MRAAKVPFDKLPGLFIPQAKSFVINPMGFNLILDREQLGRILGIKIPAAMPVGETHTQEIQIQDLPKAETPVTEAVQGDSDENNENLQ